MSVDCGVKVRHSELIPQGITRPFESACAHCAALRAELDELTRDLESIDRECDEFMDENRSLRLQIQDLEDELASTRAGHPR